MGIFASKPIDVKPVVNDKPKIDYEKYRSLLIENQNIKSDNEALILQVNSLKDIIEREGKIINKLTEALEKNVEISKILSE